MPIYDFECASCGFKAELLRKISEPSQTVCPQCAKATFAKMLSAPSFQLNGTGWYASDFKDKKPKSNDKVTDKTDTKKAEVDTKAVACNPGCACH
ncbi:MAG TPA: zinc ribbon domain-containing protein [Methylotenera sp.]|nr:zinc ribbon domain-containing protein [Methylotenera sp.]